MEGQSRVFDFLVEKQNTSFIEKSEFQGCNSIEDYLIQTISNSIFPSVHEDYQFFKSVWSQIRSGFHNWYLSQTKDGKLLTKLMDGQISVEEFSHTASDTEVLARY